jgi:hypothetical protein
MYLAISWFDLHIRFSIRPKSCMYVLNAGLCDVDLIWISNHMWGFTQRFLALTSPSSSHHQPRIKDVSVRITVYSWKLKISLVEAPLTARYWGWPSQNHCLQLELVHSPRIQLMDESCTTFLEAHVKTLIWSETGQIASDFYKNWSRLWFVSRRFWIWHSRRNLRNVA